jgi:hypothetical protein
VIICGAVMLVSLTWLIWMYYIEVKLIVYDKLWDIKTISLSDFSVEVKIHYESYQVYLDLVREKKVSISFKEYMKKVMEAQIKRKSGKD